MPDSAQERTEAPTPRRREEARESGRIARSHDLNAAVALLGGLLMLHWWGDDMLGRLLTLTRNCLGEDGIAAMNPHELGPAFREIFLNGGRLVLPLLVGIVVVTIVIGYLQVGWLITFKPLMPSFERLNPLAGIARMFSGRSMAHLVMGVLKMAVLSLVTYWTLKGRIDVLAHASGMSHLAMVAVAMDLIFTLGLRLAIVLLILAIMDYVYQRYRMEKDLRMTKEEIKEEMKRMDGDPKIKSRRRQIQLQMALHRIRGSVPKADVVITNPTEFAVALQYDRDTMAAPRVVAKGTDFLAKKIREIAIEHGVPIVEKPPLARALYRDVEVGQQIPAEFYKAVAEVLAYVYELAGRGYRRHVAAGVSLN